MKSHQSATATLKMMFKIVLLIICFIVNISIVNSKPFLLMLLPTAIDFLLKDINGEAPPTTTTTTPEPNLDKMGHDQKYEQSCCSYT